MRCIVCKADLEDVSMGFDNQPYGGLEFTSYGHYGSTAFDPMDNTFLAVNICDDCIKQNAADILHASLTAAREFKYGPWRP